MRASAAAGQTITASTSALVSVEAVLSGEQRSLEVRFGLIDLGCGDAWTEDPKTRRPEEG